MEKSHSGGRFVLMFVGVFVAVMVLFSSEPAQAGFLNSCTFCHGMPPKDGVRKANPHYDSMSSSFTGSHQKHLSASPVAADCSVCHTPVADTSFGHQNDVINMASSISGGSYGKPLFFNQTSAPVMTTCSNVSCHADPYSAGTVITPVWGVTSGCAACHQGAKIITATGPATGSHTNTTGHAVACILCHAPGTTAITAPTLANGHNDGNIDVANVGYLTPNKTKGTAGTTCSAASCHASPVAATTVVTPAWGTSGNGCAACHTGANAITATGPATGSHTKHTVACTTCHATGTTATTAATLANGHNNGTIDVIAFGYPANKLKGSPAGTCATVACHGQGAPTWGATYSDGSTFPYSTNQCEKCHGATTSVPFYSTAIPKAIGNTNAKVGAHFMHLSSSTAKLSSAIHCNDCHTMPSSVTATGHMNGTNDIAWSTLATKNGTLTPTYNPSTGDCSNVYCHGNGISAPVDTATGINRTPNWKTPFLTANPSATACGTCHGFPPVTATHPAGITIPAGFGDGTVTIGPTCNCHGNINTAGSSYANIFVNKSEHVNGTVEGGACDACHGYPPARPGFVASAGNWANAVAQNYSSGGGAHTVNNHVKNTAVPSEGFANCVKCHDQADHVMAPKVFTPSTNIKVKVNTRYRFEKDVLARYSSNRLDGNAHVAGNCSNISCHFGATPGWNQR